MENTLQNKGHVSQVLIKLKKTDKLIIGHESRALKNIAKNMLT